MSDDAGDLKRVKRRRRSWPDVEKRQIVAESLRPGTSVAEVAQRHGINANMLFTWRRRQQACGTAEAEEAVKIIPVTVTARALPAPPALVSEHPGRTEIVLAAGERIIVGADVDATALLRVVKALSRR